MIDAELSYVALVSNDVKTTARVLGDCLGLPRSVVDGVPLFAIGRGALALFPLGHALVDGEAKPGVHHIAFRVADLARAKGNLPELGMATTSMAPGLGGRRALCLPRDATVGVQMRLIEPLELARHAGGILERIDHIGVASTDVREDEAVFCGKLGFAVESRQTDMEVLTAIESFTSDKYGVVYHARKPEPVGGLRVSFVTVGDCELEFLANFDPRQEGRVEHDRAGNTRQDQGAIARFVASRGRGLHHIALKTADIGEALGRLHEAGVPLIDRQGRPGSRRALIGFAHPKGMGGILMHLVQRAG